MHFFPNILFAAFAAAAPASPAAAPAPVPVPVPVPVTTVPSKGFAFNQASSQLQFTGSYDGEAIEGTFKSFAGNVQLSTAPVGVKFDVLVQVASINTDYAERDEMLKSAAWFDAKKYPTARFVSGVCVQAKVWSCPGTLSLHGISKAVTLQVALDSAKQTITGSAKLKRKEFGIGSGEWEDAGIIGPDVSIRFTVKAAPALPLKAPATRQ
jgi:polyisoprenoid-binding protein YceI